jgi:hypothetical protein
MTTFLRRVFLVSGLIMVTDLAFFGQGLRIPGVGVSLRRSLFLVLLFAGALRRITTRRYFSVNDALLIGISALFAIIWVLVVPYSYGFSVSQAAADASPLFGLLVLAVWPWDAWPEESQWRRFCSYFLWLSLTLALLTILIWVLITTGALSIEFLTVLTNLVVPAADDSAGFIFVASLEGGGYRVFWSSSIFLLGSIYFLLMAWPWRAAALSVGALCLVVFALWTTNIRAFLGAVGIFAVLQMLLSWRASKYSSMPIATVLALWIAGIVSVCVAIDPAVLGAIGLSRDASDVERVEQARALLGKFVAHPILGTGFGSYVPQVIRSDATSFAYELTFYALLMKLGVVGIAILIAYLYSVLRLVRLGALAKLNPRNYVTWAAFSTGFWFSGATNPMVTNFAGMAVLVMLLVDVRRRAAGAS